MKVNISTFDDAAATSTSWVAAGSSGEFFSAASQLDAGTSFVDQVVLDHTQHYYKSNTTSDNTSIFVYGWKF